jgi:hypothetical protein
MMKDNGYINATKMCQSGGKDYKNWAQNKNSQNLIQIIESDISSGKGVLAVEDTSAGIPAEASLTCIFIQTSNTTPIQQKISGTYVHPDLIPHIACWISPDFALKVSRIINSYNVYEYGHLLNTAHNQLHQANELLQASALDTQPSSLYIYLCSGHDVSMLWVVNASLVELSDYQLSVVRASRMNQAIHQAISGYTPGYIRLYTRLYQAIHQAISG